MTVAVAKPEIKPKSFHFQSICSFNTPCHKLQSQYGLKSKEHLNNWFLISKCVLIACVCVCKVHRVFLFCSTAVVFFTFKSWQRQQRWKTLGRGHCFKVSSNKSIICSLWIVFLVTDTVPFYYAWSVAFSLSYLLLHFIHA